jgi:hypothetical protein
MDDNPRSCAFTAQNSACMAERIAAGRNWYRTTLQTVRIAAPHRASFCTPPRRAVARAVAKSCTKAGLAQSIARLRSALSETVVTVDVEAERVFSAKHDGIMRKSAGPQRGNVTRLGEPLVTLVSRSGEGPDPRLVELVRILARRAARRWYAEQAEVQRREREPGGL